MRGLKPKSSPNGAGLRSVRPWRLWAEPWKSRAFSPALDRNPGERGPERQALPRRSESRGAAKQNWHVRRQNKRLAEQKNRDAWLSIAMSIVELAREEAERRGAQINAVHLKLGALSGVVKEALLSSYAMACEGTALQGSRLVFRGGPRSRLLPQLSSATNPQLRAMVLLLRMWNACIRDRARQGT
jgi:hypothetical protein